MINTLKLIKIYNNKININFHGNKTSKDSEYCTCLSVMLFQTLLLKQIMIMTHKYFQENVKYAVKKKNIINAINKELNLDGSNDDESDKSDEENSKKLQ